MAPGRQAPSAAAGLGRSDRSSGCAIPARPLVEGRVVVRVAMEPGAVHGRGYNPWRRARLVAGLGIPAFAGMSGKKGAET
jgi:hypothetical protein